MAAYAGSAVPYTGELGRVLIIYYSWTGHTQDVARRIQKLTKGDLYEIETVETFKESPAFYARVKKQLKTGEYPALKEKPLNIKKYDTVFGGAPTGWYAPATPMLAFLAETDFEGKYVVPFSTQGSNFGTFFEDFNAKAKNARVLKEESFNNLNEKYDEAVDNKISLWLNGLPPVKKR